MRISDWSSDVCSSDLGESPQAASARMRLERAADLLDNSEMMIGEVAAASGFDNCCSFARAFRVRYGMSATGYRNAARKRALAPASALGSANARSRPDSAKPRSEEHTSELQSLMR